VFDRSAHVYDLLYSFKDYEAEARDLASLILERSPGARSILDVACGTGRHLELLRATFPEVAGADLDAGMLRVAQDRLPGVELAHTDMRDLDLGRRFDAVTCLFSSVGYLPDAAALGEAIARMRAHLTPGGVLVVDGWIRPDRWHEPGGVHALAETSTDLAVARVVRSRREGARTILEMRYLIATRDGFETAEEVHTLTLFTDEQYRRAFRDAGLEPDVVPGPMGDDRDRYVAVGPT
jgi:SAM-dependent methyltransferase